MKVVYSKKISDVATKPTIFERTPTESKKDFMNFFKIFHFPPEIRMNNTCTCIYTCTCNYNCLQHKQNPLWQFSRQNLIKQMKKQQFIFLGNFFSISLILKINKFWPRLEPQNLRVQKQLIYLQAKGKQPGRRKRRNKKISQLHSQQVIQLILLS